MTPLEIARITEICASLGVKKVKITGGEPLLREDLEEIVSLISKIPGLKEISLVSNGLLLASRAKSLKNVGLKRVNISLDTLRSDLFRKLTGGGNLDDVIKGIDAALKSNLLPVKLNTVILKGINENEIEDLIKFASRYGLILQLIELVETEESLYGKYFYDLSHIEDALASRAKEIIMREKMHGRKKYILDEAEVEVVRPLHNSEFCLRCTRLRITPDGKFKPCLLQNDGYVDFLSPLRQGASVEELNKIVKTAVERRKPYFMGVRFER